jgi:hypothetical protein
MPQEKQTCALTLVAKKLFSGQIHNPKCSLTHPRHKWILPQVDLQRVPYVPPREQRVPKQRVPKQSVTLKEREPENNMPSQLPTLTRMTDAPPIMLAPNPTTRRALRLTKCTHSRRTCNKIPGSISLITNMVVRRRVPLPSLDPPIATAPQCSTPIRTLPMQPATTRRSKDRLLPVNGMLCHNYIISQEAKNFLTG